MGGIRYGAIAIIVCLVAIGGLYEGDKPPKKLIGYWEVTKVEKNDGTIRKGNRKFLEFHKDGTLQGGKVGSYADKNGNWTYTKDSNTLTLSGDPGYSGDYEILELNSTDMEMLYLEDSTKIYMIKYQK
mgnify:CR=1 FL=1